MQLMRIILPGAYTASNLFWYTPYHIATTGSLFITYLCGLEETMKPCYANFEVNT